MNKHTQYFENGKVMSETPLNAKGLGHGLEVHYFLNGRKRFEFPLKNDMMHGLTKGYHRNGQTAWTRTYVYGVPKDDKQSWDKKGNKINKN